MLPGISARDELEATIAEYRHVQSEHRRAGVEGTVRRHLHTRLGQLGSQFERLLEHSIADEETREAWRRCLHEGGPAPAEPEPPPLAKRRAMSSARSSKRLLRRVPTSPVPPDRQGGMPSPSPRTARSH